MATLPTELRNKLERTCIAARNIAERAATDALKSLAVANHEPYAHMTPVQRTLRNQLRARARQVGDTQDAKGQLSIEHLAQECAYEHWHRMLFARFLAENNLLIEPEMGVPVSLDEVKALAKEAKTDLWTLAGRYAQTMLPEIFRVDDPVLRVPLAREDQIKLEQLLDALAKETFTASDSLGWCYQFWQAERKDQVNAAGNKIGADELPSVTQLFTEDYMVDFLLDNTLGAWWAGKVKAEGKRLKAEEEARKAVALPGCSWKYLRFVQKDGEWTPAAGTFDGWPNTAKELKCLDPCMGSGHFVVAMFDRLVALRMAEEKLAEWEAVIAVIRDNLYGLEIDPRCTQIAAFNLALAAWRRAGHRPLPAMNLACSGLAPNARESDWVALAGDNQKLRSGMERLYRLFKNAPVLGSLINPRAGGGDLLVAEFHELQPLLEKALAGETKLRDGLGDIANLEMAVTARGLAKAAEILAGKFTLIVTNVPYLGRGKQDEVLKDYCERVHPEAKSDLATCFIERCLGFCASAGTSGIVAPQNWLFLGSYKSLRESMLRGKTWNVVVQLGEHAFESSQAAGAFVAMVLLSESRPSATQRFAGIEASAEESPAAKGGAILLRDPAIIAQAPQLTNPDAVITFEEPSALPILETIADAPNGSHGGDSPRHRRVFWEFGEVSKNWRFFQSTVEEIEPYGGREFLFSWFRDGQDHRDNPNAYIKGEHVTGKRGVVVSMMRELPVTLYSGELFDISCTPLVPKKQEHLAAIWAFCSSPEYFKAVRKIDRKINVTNATLAKVPFDLAHWQKVAAEKYPNGLPKPYSSNPTQWLFDGRPKGADEPLQVAMARLLGYQWPRQIGSSFPDCPAVGPDGLEKMADDDGIVCIPSVRGESPAAERLRKLLQTAYGKDWKAHTEIELIRASGSEAADLEEWLRNDFFEQHCTVLQQRPFVWHIWDGRKRDGFHGLVNYHTLAGDKGKGRRTLESLTHSYLGDWITRQKDGLKRGEEGADERLAAALALKEKLEAIIHGEPPYDIFVRWKPLARQPIGWEPDINDGVRMNVRPFATADVLRKRMKIKWDKDRGKEPKRDKSEFPWFYDGSAFIGDRVNDVHLTREQKEKARKE